MKPVLYILMRTDLNSLNPGKAMAQAAHAANAFVLQIESCQNFPNDDEFEYLIDLYNEWVEQTAQGFGTTVVLAVNTEQKLNQLILEAHNFAIADTVYDPTYPIRDGGVTHEVPLTVCGYIFGDANSLKLYKHLRNLELHP